MDGHNIAAAPGAGLKAELDKLAKGCRILEIHGHGDRIYGHLAMRDPEGRGFWLKRHAISLGEVFDWRDFVLLEFDGEQLFGDGRQHSEWPIHAEILRARPDVNVTGHTHPFYGTIYSAAEEPLRSVTGIGAPPPRFEDTLEFIDTPALGRALAAALGQANTVFLRNHGIVYCGATIEGAVDAGIRMEEKCHQMLTVAAADLRFTWPGDEEIAAKVRSTGGPRYRNNTALWDFYLRVLARAEAQGDPALSHARVENVKRV
ncbi:MAG TPA: class II aldolase/adducin family protein [Alphaproteobacteria bacterium]